MAAFQTIMTILTAIITIYSVLVLFRVLLTWFRGADLGRVEEYLGAVTDPYINWFRRFRIFRIGAFDFSVIGALVVLSIVGSITGRLAAEQAVTLGIVAAIVLTHVWSVISFFLWLFLILGVVRLLGILLGANSVTRFWIILDQILEPLVHGTVYKLARGRLMSYQNALIIFSALALIIVLLGRFLVLQAEVLLVSLPI